MPTMQIIGYFSQTHPLKPNLCCIGKKKQQGAFTSSSRQRKELMFPQESAISSLRGKLLKSVDYLTHSGSNISSTKIDVDIFIGKTWTGINSWSIILKYDLSKQ